MGDSLKLMQALAKPTDSRILLLIMDGIGDLPGPGRAETALEAARTPNLDRLAKEGSLGLLDPVAPGITPGSGPGHFALFGYDPLTHDVGRGTLAALGIGFEMQPGDVAARINFAGMDRATGHITDRRAGRIPTDECARLAAMLDSQVTVTSEDGVQVFIRPVMDYRAVLVLRGDNLGADIADTDPQQTGRGPLAVRATSPGAERTARAVNDIVAQAFEILAEESPANAILLRGFAELPVYPQMQDVYKLTPACIATYPDYRGVAKLIGMDLLDCDLSLESEIATLHASADKYDFIFFHVKKTDSAGEDGDFDRKVSVIEEVDAHLPEILKHEPDAVAVTGDHSTPAVLRAHSWHPVPVLVHSKYTRPEGGDGFGESACRRGHLGRLPSTALMPILMANALKLAKYGA